MGPGPQAACSHVHMHERERSIEQMAIDIMDVIYKVRETVSQCVYQLAKLPHLVNF